MRIGENMKDMPGSKVIPHPSALEQTCEPVACAQCGVYQLCLPLGLHQTDMSLLESIVKRKEIYKRGQLFFRPGERFDFIYAIRSGSVKTYVCTPDGRVQITGFHIAGPETHALGRDDLVGKFPHLGAALGVSKDHGVAVAFFKLKDVLGGYPGVGRAETLPGHDIAARGSGCIPGEMLIRHEYHLPAR